MRSISRRLSREIVLIKAFMLSEFKSRTAYKTRFATSILGPIFVIISWVFMASSIEAQQGLKMYGDISPLAFLVSGVAVSDIVRLANQFVIFRPDMFFEYFTEPLPLWKQLLYRRIGLYVEGLLNFAVYIVIGTLLGMRLNANLGAFLLVIALGSLLEIAYGLMTSGCRLVVKVGDPIPFVLQGLNMIFSGMMFPITVLPKPLMYISWILPQTWVLYLARLTLFSASSIYALRTEFALISVAVLILLLLGYLVFKKGINKIKTEGMVL